MTTPVKNTSAMIAGMEPMLVDGTFAFVPWPDGKAWPEGTRASCVEDEGLSLVIPVDAAPDDAVPMRCITLQVHSSLEGVGLTAAVSAGLAAAGIPANVVAGYHHDHVYLPADKADLAMDILRQLQQEAAI
ncbi:ACT domain protein [Falsiruegeria litorea R37]|uniref:ACT domain protein n=1 Tax=Falsiruegeria litorea R37 TaxID=1200284 RepID=A0A1Y5SB87_9RHOB|nr:ACT domain-containing protein [Falsiruegeria litorea]SLN36662.1 ACT domain protein [Falsiruegeria litorea R37]